MDECIEARARMVADQSVRRGIGDARVLQAMSEVPRHLFVPEASAPSAYADRALPIGEGQTISQPYMVALMTEALHVRADACVLEIGTGSGYQAAVLSKLARAVVSVERKPQLASHARQLLASLGYSNITVVDGDGSCGYPAGAPYGGIIVTAGAPIVPSSVKAQLAEGARLVIPVGTRLEQRLIVVERREDGFVERSGEACVFVPLIGEGGWPIVE